MTPILIKSYQAANDVDPYKIAAFSGANNQIIAASSATSKSLGVIDAQGAVSGQMSSVIQVGQGEVKLGGTVQAGDELTADANGHAIAIAAGVTARSVGMAQVSGVAGDIIPLLVNPSTISIPA